jgi:uncharacterized membrane protein YfhO
VGRYNEECIRIVNSKIDRVDKDAYTKFVGKVKADLKFIKGSKSEEADGTVTEPAKFNDRFEEREHILDEQNKMLQGIEEQKKEEENK